MKYQSLKVKQQHGAVMLVGLVMLLLLTVIGLASIRGTDLQERMAGNMKDRNLAFQAAEAALRSAESNLNLVTNVKYDGTVVGFYPDCKNNTVTQFFPAANACPELWDSTMWGARSVALPASTLPGLVQPPRYEIEQVLVSVVVANEGSGIDQESNDKTTDGEYYRVTSRGLGGTTDSEVILQTTFVR